MDALTGAGVAENRIYSDKASGRSMNRPGLERVRKTMRPGDCLVVWKLDRLGRSALGLAQVVKELEEDGIHFKALDWDIDTTQPFGKLVFHIMAAIAELESALISERTKAGVAAAKARGQEFGRKHYILGYPKRHAAFTALWVSGELEGMTAAQVVDEMHKADKRAPKFTTPQSYRNWKAGGYSGFDVEAANALRKQDL
jgi:DNA invertase Pin-like site-specific DNA recombinase